MAEKTPVLGGMSFGEGNVIFVVTVFTELLCGFLALGFDKIMELTMVVIVGNATGRFGWCLPEKGQDYNGYCDE